MWRHHFKISFRALKRDRGFAVINIGGLALGMAIAILIGLWIFDELNYNKNHEHYDKIGKVLIKESWYGKRYVGSSQVPALGTILSEAYGDHLEYVVSAAARSNVIAIGNNKFSERGYYMDADAPEMLTLKMIRGNRDGLENINSILLSESLSNQLFGTQNAIGQTITIDANWPMQVTGVYKDLPQNSQFRKMKFIAPLDHYYVRHKDKEQRDSWDNYSVWMYARLAEGRNFEAVNEVIKDAVLPFINAEAAAREPEVFLQPMSKWHLYSEFDDAAQPVMSEELRTIGYFSLLGVFILVLAGINFTNLSTARSEKRAKEIGVRKTMGSRVSQLIQQFLSESFIITALAFLLSLGLVQLVLPWFNVMAEKQLTILWSEPRFWLTSLGFTLLTSLLAGIYPAFVLSRFKPVRALKGGFQIGNSKSLPRQILVVFQFTISIVLIVATIGVYQQIQLAKDRSLGYTQDNLLMIELGTDDYKGKYDLLRSELLNTRVVEEMTESRSPVNNEYTRNTGFEWAEKAPDFDPHFTTSFVRPSFGRTVGWELVDGNDFSGNLEIDKKGVILNEAAVAQMGLTNPVGQSISWDSKIYETESAYTILGVVKDMVRGYPWEAASPSIVFATDQASPWVHLRFPTDVELSSALQKIEKVFNKVVPAAPFNYVFVDEDYERYFEVEKNIGLLAGFFSFLTILISGLGLLGLAAYVVERRAREIGIRKVLGASVSEIWQMLSKDFVLLVLIACLVAIPLSYYALNAWLQSFEYRIELVWWIFAAAGTGALMVSLVIVSFQTFKAALINPANTLKSE